MSAFSNAFMTPKKARIRGKERLVFVQDFAKEDTPFPYLYDQVMLLRQEGLSASKIAKRLKMKRGTVENYIYRGGMPQGRKSGYVLYYDYKYYHICDPDIEHIHGDWEVFTFPNGTTGYLLPSKMNFEIINQKF